MLDSPPTCLLLRVSLSISVGAAQGRTAPACGPLAHYDLNMKCPLKRLMH